MDNLWLKVEDIVAKGEIAQFLLLSLCFQKAEIYQNMFSIYRAVLESHHAALTFKLTRKDPNIDIFKNLDRYYI